MTDETDTKSSGGHKPSKALKSAIDEFQTTLDASGGHIGDRWLLMALGNDDVLQAFDSHLKDDQTFSYMTTRHHAQDQVNLVFEFRATPPKVCLTPKRFLAVINPMTGQTVSVVDPYLSDADTAQPQKPPSESEAASHPAVGASHPAFGASHPAVGMSHPAVGASHPAVGVSHPAVGMSHPAVGVDLPGFGGERLAHFSRPTLECDGALEVER